MAETLSAEHPANSGEILRVNGVTAPVATEPPTDAPANSGEILRVNTLSEWQRRVLLSLLAAYEHLERRQAAYDAAHPDPPQTPQERWRRPSFRGWGVPYARAAPGTPRSASAVRSRALRSLERRGYVRRRNQSSGDPYSGYADGFGLHPNGRRTTHLELTPEGRALAEALRRQARAAGEEAVGNGHCR